MKLEDIDIENLLPSENKFLKKRKNGLVLTDYQVETMERYNIDYLRFSNYKDLLFEIEEIINGGYSDENLERLSEEINELIYYNYTNK